MSTQLSGNFVDFKSLIIYYVTCSILTSNIPSGFDDVKLTFEYFYSAEAKYWRIYFLDFYWYKFINYIEGDF